MLLTLTVVGAEAGTTGIGLRRTFREDGGTVGRLSDNTLVLPDPHVSGRHAAIRYAGGEFYLEDTSRNGIAVNRADQRLRPGQPYALRHGDRILIESYEIEASLSRAPIPLAASEGDDPFLGDHAPTGLLDPLAALGVEADATPAPRTPRGSRSADVDVLRDHLPVPALIPDDYEPMAPASTPGGRRAPEARAPIAASASVPSPVAAGAYPAAHHPAATPMPAPVSARGVSEAAPKGPAGEVPLSAMLRAAGIDAPSTPELAERLGLVVRAMVDGLMDVLEARQQTKEEFRIGMTRFKRAHNNPLKFSASTDDALHNLLSPRHGSFLPPVAAVEDAFGDLRHHQVATLAGLRVAFEAMLAQFDPQRLQPAFDAADGGALVRLPASLRRWPAYCRHFAALTRDADTAFAALFGEPFARAYDEQLRQLKTQRTRSPRAEVHGEAAR